MAEQIMAATLLGTYTTAHDTNPLPKVIIRNPPKASFRICFVFGKGSLLMKIR